MCMLQPSMFSIHQKYRERLLSSYSKHMVRKENDCWLSPSSCTILHRFGRKKTHGWQRLEIMQRDYVENRNPRMSLLLYLGLRESCSLKALTFSWSASDFWWMPQFGRNKHKGRSYNILRRWFTPLPQKKPLTKAKWKKTFINLHLWVLRIFLKLWNFHLPELQLSPKIKTTSRGQFGSFWAGFWPTVQQLILRTRYQ